MFDVRDDVKQELISEFKSLAMTLWNQRSRMSYLLSNMQWRHRLAMLGEHLHDGREAIVNLFDEASPAGVIILSFGRKQNFQSHSLPICQHISFKGYRKVSSQVQVRISCRSLGRDPCSRW